MLTEKYLVREGRELVPTAKAFSLITLLKGLGIDALTSPELTGEWEHKLALMEKRRLAREEFMASIARMAQDIVERAKRHESDTVPGDFATLQAPCPKCGGTVRETYKTFQCDQCGWSMWKIIAGRQIDVPEAEALLTQGRIGPLEGFRSRLGRPFAAELVLDEAKQPTFAFAVEPPEEVPADLAERESLGPCPKCGAPVVEHGTSYVCTKSLGPDKTCDFRSGRTILQQPIEPEQMKKLLSEGKTDLLTGFVSARTRRKFSAYLVRQPDGKIGFEFEPREASEKKGRSATRKKAKAAETS